VGQLDYDPDFRVLADRQHRLQRRFGHVVPQAKISGRNAAFCFDRGGFDTQQSSA
jgi:hypothetical protein